MDRLTQLRVMTHKVRKSTTIALWVCMICSVGMFIASFLVPPVGEISPSVLRAVGLLFAFAALFVGREAIMEGLGVKMTHGQTTIEIHDLDGDGNEHPQHPERHEHFEHIEAENYEPERD